MKRLVECKHPGLVMKTETTWNVNHTPEGQRMWFECFACGESEAFKYMGVLAVQRYNEARGFDPDNYETDSGTNR